MDRREALSRVALIMGGTIIGAQAFITGCKPTPKKRRVVQHLMTFRCSMK
jgi:hypothetical protein